MNTIEKLSIENFTAFRRADFVFSSGINVLIGENSTGKTHILKLIYALLKTAKEIEDGQADKIIIPEKLLKVFRPNDLDFNRLVRPWPSEWGVEGEHSTPGKFRLSYGRQEFELTLFAMDPIPGGIAYPSVSRRLSAGEKKFAPPVLYLPSGEILSIYPGFIASYLNRETSFDETYFDLCVALNTNPLRPSKYKEVKHLNEPLEKILGGENKVTLDGDQFYVELPDAGRLEANLVAEGYRKLATLVHLIRNGSLTPGTVLLWDEPQANLNPKLVTAVVEFLINFAEAGGQIFLATHDYLLSQELSLHTEYGLTSNIKFFSLYREVGQDGVLVESGESLADIDNNPILDEFLDHYERENKLLHADVPTVSK